MTVDEIATVAANAVRERVMRNGGYCPFGCSHRCDCAGALWPALPEGVGALFTRAYTQTRPEGEEPPMVRFYPGFARLWR